MKTSVLLPVYNGAKTLEQTLNSVLNQDFADFEVLISDDCSTDNSREIIWRLAAQDSRIRTFIFDARKGLAVSLNFLIDQASTDYLMRIDQDDLCLPHRLRTLYEFLLKNPHIAVVGSNVYHMGATCARDRLIQLPETPSAIREALKDHNCIYHPATMLRKSLVQTLGGYRPDFRNAEDYDLWLRLSRSFDLYNIQEPLLRYRFSVNGMTLSRRWEQLFYVNLALVAAEFPDLPLEKLYPLAKERHQATGKESFLEIVYTHTIRELVRLGFRREAARIWWMMFREVGLKNAVRRLPDLLFASA